MKIPSSNLIQEVPTSDMHNAEAVLLILHVKVTPGWALILINFDLMREIEPKVGGECSFVSGRSFPRLQYTTITLLSRHVWYAAQYFAICLYIN